MRVLIDDVLPATRQGLGKRRGHMLVQIKHSGPCLNLLSPRPQVGEVSQCIQVSQVKVQEKWTRDAQLRELGSEGVLHRTLVLAEDSRQGNRTLASHLAANHRTELVEVLDVSNGCGDVHLVAVRKHPVGCLALGLADDPLLREGRCNLAVVIGVCVEVCQLLGHGHVAERLVLNDLDDLFGLGFGHELHLLHEAQEILGCLTGRDLSGVVGGVLQRNDLVHEIDNAQIANPVHVTLTEHVLEGADDSVVKTAIWAGFVGERSEDLIHRAHGGSFQ